MVTMPPAPDPKSTSISRKPLLLGAVIVLIIGVWLLRDGGPNMRPIDPNATITELSPEPELGAAVEFEVLSCNAEYGFATARISVTVSEPFSYVGFHGDFTDAGGVVTGQGIGNLTDVVPGQTYKTDVIYSLSGAGSPKQGTCGVVLDSAF